jgi:hypothetical protein
MKRPRPKVSRPPYPGPYVKGPITELVCEEDKAGRPLAPVVELLSPRPADEDRADQTKPAEAPPQPE